VIFLWLRERDLRKATALLKEKKNENESNQES